MSDYSASCLGQVSTLLSCLPEAEKRTQLECEYDVLGIKQLRVFVSLRSEVHRHAMALRAAVWRRL